MWKNENLSRSSYYNFDIELGKHSPAGEDFNISLVLSGNLDEDEEIDEVIRELNSYYNDFDVDEHAEIWIEWRGKRGVPSSIRELVENAEAIDNMVKKLVDDVENS